MGFSVVFPPHGVGHAPPDPSFSPRVAGAAAGGGSSHQAMPPRPRHHLQKLEPYEWEASLPEVARAAGVPESAVVRFDLNTAPWPPVGWAETVARVAELPVNEYLHPSNEPLRGQLAGRLGLPPERLVVTAGADEALYLVAQAFLGPRRRAVLPTPTFAMFTVVTQTVGGEILEVPLDERWELPEEPLLGAIAQPGVRVAWLCSPNNPTGRLVSQELVRAAAHRAPDALVVVDEAYFEIAGQTAAPLLEELPNLLLVRTFSKGYGLAGARVGYAFGRRRVAALLDAVRPPQNLSAFGLLAASSALRDEEGLRRRVAALRAERDRLRGELAGRGWEVVPSEGNFLLVRPPGEAPQIARRLQRRGLVIRSYPDHPRLGAWLRITVRSPEEDDRLLDGLDRTG